VLAPGWSDGPDSCAREAAPVRGFDHSVGPQNCSSSSVNCASCTAGERLIRFVPISVYPSGSEQQRVIGETVRT